MNQKNPKPAANAPRASQREEKSNDVTRQVLGSHGRPHTMTIPVTAINGNATANGTPSSHPAMTYLHEIDDLLPHHQGTTTDILADTSPGPFEGPEKLLEVWFAPGKDELPDTTGKTVEGREGKEGLRRVPREVWEEMLRIVRCQVLSVIEGEEIDAYLLR